MYKLPTPLFIPYEPNSATNDLLTFWQPELEKFTSKSILQWAVDTFDSQLAFAPSRSEEDEIVLSLFEEIAYRVPKVEQIYELLLPESWTPLEPREELGETFDGRVASSGLWARFHVEHLCKRYENTISCYRVWIVSTRREQDIVFERMPVLSWSERFGVLRIAPLAHWENEGVAQEMESIAAKKAEASSDRFCFDHASG